MFAIHKKDYLTPEAQLLEMSAELLICTSDSVSVALEDMVEETYDWEIN